MVRPSSQFTIHAETAVHPLKLLTTVNAFLPTGEKDLSVEALVFGTRRRKYSW